MAVGLSTVVHGIGSRRDIERNLQIVEDGIGRLVARGSFTPPAHAFPGARYIAPAESPDEADWEHVRSLWSPPAEE
jgi:hypothetical protein